MSGEEGGCWVVKAEEKGEKGEKGGEETLQLGMGPPALWTRMDAS
ncbi:hypothetical protein BFJ71_g1816 [Fusarium oxysporum]|nr:hypothetical protein BFJ71_g1816 [Fusarium oxysporum]